MKSKNATFEIVLLNLLLGTGFILAFIQFYYNRSLWLDEAMLANNIIDKNFIDLLKPLDNYQAAPVLFLWVVKLSSLLAGTSELALRTFSFLCFAFAGIFFLRYLKKHTQNIIVLVFALGLFVFNAFLIRYSSELKQYITDVFFSTLFLFLIQHYTLNKSKRTLLILTIAGVSGVFFSHIVVILINSTILLFVYDSVKNKQVNKSEILSLLIWLIAVLCVYFGFINNHPTKKFMLSYWANAGAFLPISGSFLEIMEFLKSKFIGIFFQLLPFGQLASKGFIILFILGIFNLLKEKKWSLVIFYFSPLFIHLILSALKIYPLENRFIIYLLPFFILVIAEGFRLILSISSVSKREVVITILSIVIPLVMIKKTFENRFPIKIEEVKELITYFNQHAQNEDKIYVYYSAKPAINFYLKTKIFNPNFPVIFGNNHRENSEAYIKEFPKKYKKIWLFFTHIYKNEDKYILNELQKLGYKEISKYKSVGACLYCIQVI